MGEPIKIWQPRYRDNSCLVARFRIPCGRGINVEILKGARKGLYKVSSEDICSSPIETMRTKAGKFIEMRAIPLDKLVRVE